MWSTSVMLLLLGTSASFTPDQAHSEALVFGFLLLFVGGLIAGLVFGKG
jgi:hypothetical protein